MKKKIFFKTAEYTHYLQIKRTRFREWGMGAHALILAGLLTQSGAKAFPYRMEILRASAWMRDIRDHCFPRTETADRSRNDQLKKKKNS